MDQLPSLLIVAEPRGHRRAQLLHRSLLRRQLECRLLLLGQAASLGRHETSLELSSPEQVAWLLRQLGWHQTEFCLAVGSQAFAYLPESCGHRLLDCQRVEQADRWKPKSLPALRQILESWRGFKAPRVNHESRAVHESELIFTCNPLVREVLISLYPRLAGKIHQPPLWLAPLLREEQQEMAATALAGDENPYTRLAQAGAYAWLGDFSWEEEALYQAALAGCRLTVGGDCGNGALASGSSLEEFCQPHPAQELMEVLPALR